MSFFRVFLSVFLLFVLVQEVAAQASRTWQDRAPMPTARTGVAAVVFNGMVYVMGGLDANGNILDVVEVYNPASNSWNTGPSLRTARYNFAAVVYEGQIYVLGGHDSDDESSKKVEVFSPSENRWESFDNLEEEREGLGAVVLNEELYVMGGANGSADILRSVEILDTEDESWYVSDEWELDVPRALFGYIAIDEFAYSVGGFTSFGPTGLVQEYNEDDGTRNLTSISPGRGGLAAAYLDDSIFAMGGRRSDNQVVNTVDRFFPSENRWEPAAAMKWERERFAAVTYEDELFVFGGNTTGGEVLNSVEVLSMSVVPAVTNDLLVTDEDVEMSINVLINDSDPEGGELSISSFSQPSNGVVAQLDASTFNYQPNEDFFGTDQFTYTALNETGGTAQATVDITIRPVNDKPVFLSTPVTGASQDSLYSYSIAASDIDNDPLTIEATQLPSWLVLTEQVNGAALLDGTPGQNELGDHDVVLALSDGIETIEQRFVITVVEGMPGQAELLSPIDGAEDVPQTVTLSWNVPGAVSYDLQLSTDESFSSIVAEEDGIGQAFLEIADLEANSVYYWRVRGVNASGVSDWAEPFTFRTAIDTSTEEELPVQHVLLHANYPNPFSAYTHIPFELSIAAPVELHIYDMRGRLVISLNEGPLSPGFYEKRWDGTDNMGRQVASGSYLVRLVQGTDQVTRMITLIR